jgi:RHS repeat-associated protein
VSAQTGADIRILTYDSFNRLRQEAGVDTVSLAYDWTGRVRHVTYPDGRRDRINLDPLGRLMSVVQEVGGVLPLAAQGIGAGSTLANVQWAGVNRIDRIEIANGLTATFSYDDAFRLALLTHEGAGAVQVQREASLRDALGLRRAVAVRAPADNESAYVYDPTSRLREVHDGLPAGTIPVDPSRLNQAGLDAATNTAVAAGFTGATRFTYSPGDMPESISELDAGGNVLSRRSFHSNVVHELSDVDGVPVAYDSAGNLRQIGPRSYEYDAYRRLSTVRDGANVVARFEYDPLGRLLRRTEGANAIRFAYLGSNILQESSAAGIVQYVSGPDLDRPLIRSSAVASHVLAYDTMGSLVAACGTGGNVLERYRYSSFGVPEILEPAGVIVRANSAIGINPHFLGREYISSCKLYDFRDRFYDPSLLSFLQPDPIPFGDTWSPYAFVRFNPINFHDPYGRWLHIVLGGIVGAAIGGVGAALSGGDVKDILAGIGVGAVGGAVTAATGNLALGAAVSGGLMGAWAGGRAGYRADGVGTAILGGAIGTVVGAGIGYVGGAIGARVGNTVATGASGLINRTLIATGAPKGTSWVVARYGGMVTGGYAGGVASGLFSNTASTVVIDAATGRPITGAQMWDSTRHSVAIDGPLNAVGAFGDRFIMIRDLNGPPSNVFGAEGELLVSREYGIPPARGTEQISINDHTRRPDFPTARTLEEYNAVFEVKNKARIFDERGGQLTDFSDYGAQSGGELWLFTRPGADVAGSVLNLPNVRIMPIPQRPLVVTVPIPVFDQRVPAK